MPVTLTAGIGCAGGDRLQPGVPAQPHREGAAGGAGGGADDEHHRVPRGLPAAAVPARGECSGVPLPHREDRPGLHLRTHILLLSVHQRTCSPLGIRCEVQHASCVIHRLST